MAITCRQTLTATRDRRSAAPASVVETACPLDCPDACSLAVTVQHGKVDRRSTARSKNPVTDGYICAKVRKFGERVYGPDRLLYPAVRSGRKGEGQFKRVDVGRSARARRRSRFEQAKADARRRVDPALLLRRLERPADAGQHRRAAVAPLRHVAARAHGLRGADRRRQHGALRQDAVGHLPGLSGSEADRPLGRQPVGVGHPPRAVRPRGAEARREARRDRSADDARWRAAADVHLAVKPGTDVAVALAIHRYLFANGHADEAFLREHTHGAERLRERAEPWTFERAAEVAGVDAAALERVRGALRGRARRR